MGAYTETLDLEINTNPKKTIWPGAGPAGRDLEINRILIKTLMETGPKLAQPAGSSKSTIFQLQS